MREGGRTRDGTREKFSIPVTNLKFLTDIKLNFNSKYYMFFNNDKNWQAPYFIRSKVIELIAPVLLEAALALPSTWLTDARLSESSRDL